MMENEKRLIDADAFGMYLADVQLANRGWKDDFCGLLDDVMDALNDFPEVDAVEVVRCKECAWCNQVEDLSYCENPNAPWIDDPDFSEITVTENDFCSYGERRSDG